MKLLLIRHGQSYSNTLDKVIGQQIDSPLTALGIQQVELLSDFLPWNLELIYSSPLIRTKQTASIIAKNLPFPVPIIFCDELKERDFGGLTGLTWKEMEMKCGFDVYKKDMMQKYNYKQYGGESAEDVLFRIQRFIKQIPEVYFNEKKKNILVVSSAGIIRMMNYLVHKKRLEDIKFAFIYEYQISNPNNLCSKSKRNCFKT